MKTLLVIALVVSFAATSGVARANHLPDSDAESIAILAALTPAPQGYWWDHTDLTVAIKAPRKADPEYLSAIQDAITTWSTVLQHEFGGLITLTDVTDPGAPAHQADIVLHYVPHAGGLAFSGVALCQAGHCSNVLVSTVGPPGHGLSQFRRRSSDI